MRRISRIFLVLVACLLLSKATKVNAAYMPGMDPSVDENYYDVEFMGEYVEGGMLVEGSSLRTSYAYLNYDFENVTRDGEKIKASQINTSFDAENQYVYEFDLIYRDDFLLFKPAESDVTSYSMITSNGETLYGKYSLEVIRQNIHVLYEPDRSVSESFEITFDCEYRYTFIVDETGETINGTILYYDQFRPYVTDQTNQSYEDYREVSEKMDDEYLILSFDNNDNFWVTDDKNNQITFNVVPNSIPFVIEGGRIIYAYMSNGDYDGTEIIEPEEEDRNILVPIVSVIAIVGVSSAAAAVGSAVSNAASTGAGIVDAIAKRMDDKKAFYDIEFNGGVDLAPVICEEGKIVEIPFRIDGGEADQWFFLGKSFCERNHKQKIPTFIPPSAFGSSVIKVTLQGDEVKDKDMVQVSVIAWNPKKISQTMLGVFEFEVVEKAKSKEL